MNASSGNDNMRARLVSNNDFSMTFHPKPRVFWRGGINSCIHELIPSFRLSYFKLNHHEARCLDPAELESIPSLIAFGPLSKLGDESNCTITLESSDGGKRDYISLFLFAFPSIRDRPRIPCSWMLWILRFSR
jgi:hypothetical protein